MAVGNPCHQPTSSMVYVPLLLSGARSGAFPQKSTQAEGLHLVFQASVCTVLNKLPIEQYTTDDQITEIKNECHKPSQNKRFYCRKRLTVKQRNAKLGVRKPVKCETVCIFFHNFALSKKEIFYEKKMQKVKSMRLY